MVSMPLAGKLIERWGSRRVASPAAVGFATALLLLAFAQLCHAHPGGGGFWRLERSAGCLG
jgi:MFS family permease